MKTKTVSKIEIKNHIYTLDGKDVYVQPYSMRFDVYCDPVLIGIATNGLEFQKIARQDAEYRKDPFKGK